MPARKNPLGEALRAAATALSHLCGSLGGIFVCHPLRHHHHHHFFLSLSFSLGCIKYSQAGNVLKLRGDAQSARLESLLNWARMHQWEDLPAITPVIKTRFDVAPSLVIRFVMGFQLDFFRRCITPRPPPPPPASLSDVNAFDRPLTQFRAREMKTFMQREEINSRRRVNGRPLESEIFLHSTFHRLTQLLLVIKVGKETKPLFTFDLEINKKLVIRFSFKAGKLFCLTCLPFPDQPQPPNLATATHTD